MKKFYLFLFNYGVLLLLEFIYGILTFDNFSRSTIINIILFMIPISLIITLITSLFNEKVNKIITFVIYGFLGIWYNIYFVFEKIFDSFFSLSVFKLSDQGLKFAGNGISGIFKNIYGVLLLFLPLILAIILKDKLSFKKMKLKEIPFYLLAIIVFFFVFTFNVEKQKGITYSAYDLYHNINDNALNIEKLGLINATFIDIDRSIRGFEEKIIINNKNDNKENKDNQDKNNKDEIFVYEDNKLDIDFDSILNKVSGDNKTITNYIMNDTPTKQNKYTGIFKNKNLIYITAESFSEIAVSKELTPTLYKLVNDGFHFTNYYSSNNLSTIGGEFQSLTGLYANNTILKTWRSGNNYFPYGLATMFKNEGYQTYAYHDHSYTFQDRNKYIKSMGFDNFKACYNGLEKLINCKQWPESDVEMIEQTTSDYLDNDKFMTYYMTVSGHFEYNWGNKMSKKHYEKVKDLPYSEPVKAYLATQIELDKALELLINKLEEKGKLDETVIVLLCDHYPYGLKLEEINELSNYQRDAVVEINSNNLIIWNSKIKKTTVDKVAMSIDVIPTVYNLFGLKYDSRLFMGKDIFSDSEGIAFFKNRSWVTNKGTYLTSGNKIINNSEEVSKDYIQNISNIVANRMNMSRLIIKSNYYNVLNK